MSTEEKEMKYTLAFHAEGKNVKRPGLTEVNTYIVTYASPECEGMALKLVVVDTATG